MVLMEGAEEESQEKKLWSKTKVFKFILWS